MNKYICIHGHFYQPPRENPWLEEVELQDSAYPYHDWNDKIALECYAPNATSRILDRDERIIDIVNNYSKISFNFGPSILSYLRINYPDVYQSIIEADRNSIERFSGHGSAMAQIYNHIIMPLANSRDKRTQVIWGIRDFEHHFKRKPEGLWLSETAVDIETLEILADTGIKFTVLSPMQAVRIKNIEGGDWNDVKNGGIDIKMPYLYNLPSGKKINLFFYDATISQGVAFGELLKNGEIFAERLISSFNEEDEGPQLVNIANDGETYGHHRRFGDMALAYCLYHIESNNLANLTNYAEFLDRFPPTYEVEIIENTSWSCIHGIERWRDDCGCNVGLHKGWAQKWRAPLRGAMDWLRDTIVHIYKEEITKYFEDPWIAREKYIDVLHDRSVKNVNNFISKHAVSKILKEEKIRILRLLEMQRHAMLMYTSCGWFFDDISGIETIQIMQHASRTIQLARDISGVELEPAFMDILERAPSNIKEKGNGSRIYENYVKPAVLDLLRVGAHFAGLSLFEEESESTKMYCFTASKEAYDRVEAGRQKLAIGRIHVKSNITWEKNLMSFAVLHLGDHNLNGGVREFIKDEAFEIMHKDIKEAFIKSDIPEVILLIDKYFGMHNYSLWHLFRDDQRRVVNQILESSIKEIEHNFQQIYEHNYSIMNILNDMHIPYPKPLATTLEAILNINLRRVMEDKELDIEKLKRIVDEVRMWSLELDIPTLSFVATRKINNLMEELQALPENINKLEYVETVLEIMSSLPLNLDLWKAQNIYFSIGRQLYEDMEQRANDKNENAMKWIKMFAVLGQHLHVKAL